MASPRIIYARGFPYGAPLAIIRGGATKDADVKDFIKRCGFRWDGSLYGYKHYLNRSDLGPILQTLRDEYGCEVLPKADMDTNYRLNLDDPSYGRGE